MALLCPTPHTLPTTRQRGTLYLLSMGSGVGVAETDHPVLLGLVGHTLPPYRLNNKLTAGTYHSGVPAYVCFLPAQVPQ